ncbi:hypothetical protein QE428_001262 [Microbacterium sp. SORGH_AS 505]|uniref:hypothetical protein n=1 Tax=Microbacterium sp. SORGH_AS_0505 TaxID=3041770 RepID=UPI00278466B5|nr:hypothetical protein [Microbacterium sp. SORGH_AS_0505]MDQ1126229.1 hypothetical protein [Microbacterium sp. SORGH_AS_0505]
MLNPSKRRRIAMSGLLVIGATTLAGCAGGVTVNDDSSVAIVTDAGFLTGDEALVQGTVSITEGGCVGITDSQGDTYPTVWPTGTRLVHGSDSAIEIPGLGVRQLGDEVSGSGGYYAVTTRPVLDDVADRCGWDGDVIGVRFE